MYQGALFELFKKTAQMHQADEIYILSGKYGLLQQDEIIAPYDLNLNNQSIEYRKNWALKVINKMQQLCDLKNDNFVLICNPIYAEFIIPHLNHYKIPIEVT